MSGERTAKRILVVDDEEDVQILVCRILQDAGYDVDSASDGAEAIEKIRRRRPDLVVLDLMMPGLDGWGVFEHMRGVPDPPPVVVMTARTDYGAFARGVREGAAAYISKPFRFHELVATCHKVLLSAVKPAPSVAVERRRSPRRRLSAGVEVISRDRAPIAVGEIVDLGAGGAQVELGVPLEPGDSVRVAFHTPGGRSAPALEGRVCWRGPAPGGHAHGLAFVSLSLEHERQLMELLLPPE